jgi:hypothetical protein
MVMGHVGRANTVEELDDLAHEADNQTSDEDHEQPRQSASPDCEHSWEGVVLACLELGR